MKESWFDKILSNLLICRFYKICRSIFYLFGIAVMIYIGYSRDAGTSQIELEIPEKNLNDENYDGIFVKIDSFYWADYNLVRIQKEEF